MVGIGDIFDVLDVVDVVSWCGNLVVLGYEVFAGLDGAEVGVVLVVDFYHAVEHLGKLAALRKKWTAQERGRWVTKQRRLLLGGKIDEVISAIDELCRGRASKAMAKERDYFVRHREAMAYGAVRARNLPIGSGAVESAIRRVVNLRIKGPGIFWHREHAELMLMLRAFHKAGRWSALKQAASFQSLPVAA